MQWISRILRKAALRSATFAAIGWGVLAPATHAQVPQPPALPDPALPQILSVRLDRPAVNQPVNLQVRAVDQQDPVSGMAVVFPGGGAFGTSACRAPDWQGHMPGPPFAPSSRVTISVPHIFRTSGANSLLMRLDAAGCQAGARSIFRPFTVTTGSAITPRASRAPGVTASSRRRIARRTLRLRAARRALLHALNAVRARRGLAPLRSNARLLRAALGHSKAMVSGSFFSHVSPAGTGLVQRVRATGYLRGANQWLVGENIGFGRGRSATPEGMVRSWMHSTPHRANILTAEFKEVGVGVAGGMPGRPGRGATYTTDFGFRR